MKAVLVVAQAGEIINAASLDELRDQVKNLLGSDVPTPTWTVKRDAFLNELANVINRLEKPAMASAAELEAAKAQYLAAMEEIGNKEKEAKVLKAHIADLENCKDRDQVKVVNQTYSNEQEQFAKVVELAKASLSKIRRATERTIFCEASDSHYTWEGEAEWDDVREADKLMEVEIVLSYGERYCQSRAEHIRVAKAKTALKELADFLKDERHSDFVMKLEDEHQFPISLKNKEFWHRVLESYV